jgi:hypothetical protein
MMSTVKIYGYLMNNDDHYLTWVAALGGFIGPLGRITYPKKQLEKISTVTVYCLVLILQFMLGITLTAISHSMSLYFIWYTGICLCY